MELKQKLEQVNIQLDNILKTLNWDWHDLKKWHNDQKTFVPCPVLPQQHSIPLSLVDQHKQQCPWNHGQHMQVVDKKTKIS